MLDYTQNAVGVRFEVDGVWMNIDPRDRQTGDAMLAVFKKIANLNMQDRRSRQEGKFGAVFHATTYICTITTQGIKTGERVLIKIVPKKSEVRDARRSRHAPENARTIQGVDRRSLKDLSSSPHRRAEDCPPRGRSPSRPPIVTCATSSPSRTCARPKRK